MRIEECRAGEFAHSSRLREIAHRVNTFSVIIDESGAKGYSDRVESTAGELGVMAGYLIPESAVATIRTKLGEICAGFVRDGKTHITDCDERQQPEMRKVVFEFFRKHEIKWVYEAIYVQGLHEHRERLLDISRCAKAMRRLPVKLSGNEELDLLHSKLLLGVFSKAVAFGIDNFGTTFGLNVITDLVDAPILERWRSEAEAFLRVGEKHTHKQTGFDPRSGKILKGAITIETRCTSDILDDLSGVAFSIAEELSPLTLAADILANSVYHQLHSAQTTTVGIDLNRADSISGHPLEALVRYTWTDPASNYIADAAFMHPHHPMVAKPQNH